MSLVPVVLTTPALSARSPACMSGALGLPVVVGKVMVVPDDGTITCVTTPGVAFLYNCAAFDHVFLLLFIIAIVAVIEGPRASGAVTG